MGFQGKQVTGFSKFIPPCVYFSHQTFETSKKGKPQASISGTERDKMKAICLIFMCIPVSPGRSRLIWAFPRNFALWAYRLVPRWLTHIQQNLFLDSDLYFLHLEVPWQLTLNRKAPCAFTLPPTVFKKKNLFQKLSYDLMDIVLKLKSFEKP